MSARKSICRAGCLAFAMFASPAMAQDNWRTNTLDAIAADDPSVVEAMFPEDAPHSFWVSMRDDGTRRDGFAEYLCLVLHQHGMPKEDLVVIRVWDAAEMARGQMKELGRFDCKLQ